MSRKLASIQRIVSINPIEGADKIELATVLGWQVIVKKGDFKIGDNVIYIEADSLLPVDNIHFDFLRKSCYSPKYNAYRIKCMKMKGVFSQGIVFPVSILPPIVSLTYTNGTTEDIRSYKEDDDVTDVLHVTKYDPEAWDEANGNSNNRKSGNKGLLGNPIIRTLCRIKWIKKLIFPTRSEFPTQLLSKTDETRIQAVPNVLNEYSGTQCYITEKIDGCSFTAVYYKGKFDVYSRTMNKTNTNTHWWRVAEKYKIKEKLKKLGLNNIAIQGEVVGDGVGNGSGCNLYNTKGNELYVFNVVDLNTGGHYSVFGINDICEKLGIPTVPIIDVGYKLGAHSIQELLELSKGVSYLNPDTVREGIVIRDIQNKYQPIRGLGEHLSFKVINPDFIMKHQDKERKSA